MPNIGAGAAFMQALIAKLLDVDGGRIADMAGIDMQVLPVAVNTLDKLDSATASGLARDANYRMAAAVQARPKRFAAFATLALHKPEEAAAEFERCVRQLGFKGVMLNGTVNGQFCDNPRFAPIFETAQALDVTNLFAPRAAGKAGDGSVFVVSCPARVHGRDHSVNI